MQPRSDKEGTKKINNNKYLNMDKDGDSERKERERQR